MLRPDLRSCSSEPPVSRWNERQYRAATAGGIPGKVGVRFGNL